MIAMDVDTSGENATAAPFAEASNEELGYLSGVFEILRANDPVFSEGIRRAVDAYRRMRRKGE